MKKILLICSAVVLLCGAYFMTAYAEKPEASASPSPTASSDVKAPAAAKPSPTPFPSAKPSPTPFPSAAPRGRVFCEGFTQTHPGKPVKMFLDYKYVPLGNQPFYVNDEFVIVPVDEICGMLGLNCRYDEKWNSVCVWIESKNIALRREILFNLDSAFTTVFGENRYISMPTVRIDGVIYVPLRPLADAFKSDVSFTDEGDHYNLNLSKSVVKLEFENEEAAELRAAEKVSKISSQTDYLVYVSKPEYLVRVYLRGTDGGWVPIKRFECAIGAPNTPTIEGEFTYYKWEKMWDYGTYYVGPVMRFYNGYALHSTLLNKKGGAYDNRTRVKISHGCVRLKKEDIDWLSAYVPLKTKVYVA